MATDLAEALSGFLDRISTLLRDDAELRASLAELLRAAACRLDVPTTVQAPVPVAASPARAPAPAPDSTPPANLPAPPFSELIARLDIGSLAEEHAPEPSPPEPDEDTGRWAQLELVPAPVLAARCRHKADAARTHTGRREGAGAAHSVRARAADQPDGDLWMLADDRPDAPPGAWADLAGCFDAAARAAELLDAWDRVADTGELSLHERVLGLAAEAQSALRRAIEGVNYWRFDPEQDQLFKRVRRETAVRKVYVPRFMRLDDGADPATWRDLVSRLDAALAGTCGLAEKERLRGKRLPNLQHKTRRLAKEITDDPAEWRRVIELTDELVNLGMPPSSVELRECLLPLFDRLEDRPELPPNVERVLRALEEYRLLTPEPGDAAGDGGRDRYSPDVAAAAALLRGREAVLIGGQNRPAGRDALVRALGLAGLNWIATREHESYTGFVPSITRPEVALVLLATRWISHDFQSVREYCDRHGKLFVKLPGGYNPNQVAHQILAQAGDRLRAAANRSVGAAGNGNQPQTR